VGELKRKIDEAERTATTLVARKNAAQAQRKVAEALAGVGNADNAFAALNRFEEPSPRKKPPPRHRRGQSTEPPAGKDDDLEKQFAAGWAGHGVDHRSGCLTGGCADETF
jgi:phage shock protein A